VSGGRRESHLVPHIRADIIFNANDDFGNSRASHAILASDLGLAFRFTVYHGKITLGPHGRFAVPTVGDGLQKLDRGLISKAPRSMASAFLRFVVAPKFFEEFQRPPIEQRAKWRKLRGSGYATTSI